MKKGLIVAITVLAVGILSACGSSENVCDMDVNKYVTIGEYKGIPVTMPKQEIREAEKQLMVDEECVKHFSAESEKITNRAVENNDLVDIDYEGKQDGVAFAGGTAAAQSLRIGSGSFVPGFEEGLVGVKPGETVDLDITFPTDYHSADLAGQKVVFTVTVNFIYPEFTDEMIASWNETNYKSMKELEEYVESYLESYLKSNMSYYAESMVVSTFLQNCIYTEIPKALQDKYRANLYAELESGASMYGMDAEGYCQSMYGMNSTEYLDMYSEEISKQMLAFQAVANAEGMVISDEELEYRLQETAAINGFASVEEFIGENDKADYKEYFMFNDVIAFLIENAVITEQ